MTLPYHGTNLRVIISAVYFLLIEELTSTPVSSDLTGLLLWTNSRMGWVSQKRIFWDNWSTFLQVGCPSRLSTNRVKSLQRAQSTNGNWRKLPTGRHLILNKCILMEAVPHPLCQLPGTRTERTVTTATTTTMFCFIWPAIYSGVTLITKLNSWKDGLESKGIKVNMNKPKVIISEESWNRLQNTGRWPCAVCGRGVGRNSIQCTSTTTPQPFYGPFSGTTRVGRCQKRTSGLNGARED